MSLDVRIVTGRSDTHVSRDITDLSFRSSVPGGFATCSLSLYRPLNLDRADIDYYGDLIVYDGRNADVMWQGRIEDIVRSEDGYDVVAVGPAAHARDRSIPLIYVDRVLDRLERVEMNVSKVGANDSVTDDPGGSGDDAMVLQFPQGLTLATNDKIVVRYRGLSNTGQWIARVDYNMDAGRTSASYTLELQVRDASDLPATVRADNFTTAGVGSNPKIVGTDWTIPRKSADWRVVYSAGGGTVPDDTVWASIRGAYVTAVRYTKAGVEMTSASDYPTGSVYAHDVVADLLGRLLPNFDGANATIATNTFAIPHLAFPDGVTAAQVLDEMMLIESEYYWAAWEDTTSNNARFEWRKWPTTARYEVSAADGFNAPASADELYNRVRVRYRDQRGRILTVERTNTVPDLDAAGLIRTYPLDLGDEIASASTAAQVGDRFLADHSRPFAKGSVTVARPVLDLTLGRYVQPWEIRPGELVRVHDVAPSGNTPTTTADGVSTYKLHATEYDLATNSCKLELDNGPGYLDTLLARLSAKATRRR